MTGHTTHVTAVTLGGQAVTAKQTETTIVATNEKVTTAQTTEDESSMQGTTARCTTNLAMELDGRDTTFTTISAGVPEHHGHRRGTARRIGHEALLEMRDSHTIPSFSRDFPVPVFRRTRLVSHGFKIIDACCNQPTRPTRVAPGAQTSHDLDILLRPTTLWLYLLVVVSWTNSEPSQLRESLLQHSIAMETPSIDVRIQASKGMDTPTTSRMSQGLT